MAKDHQLYMCYKQAGLPGERTGNFLHEGDSVSQGEVVALRCILRLVLRYATLFTQIVNDVYTTPSACIHGLKYKQGCQWSWSTMISLPLLPVSNISLYTGMKNSLC